MREDDNKNQEIEVDLDDEDLTDIDEVIDITPEDPLQTQLKTECEKSKELVDQLQRLQAEFDNFRKRMENRFEEVTRFASEEIILKMLEVYDNLSRALEMDFAANPEGAKAGIDAIQRQMEKILSNEGVHPIESIGKQFDPYYQNALNRVCDKAKPEGIILQEYQRGYMFKEKVLRPAVVCVNQHESDSAEENKDKANNINSEESGE
ncbi:nucleotide exchange factor GrpE [Candidatus Thorarchaeota archaeon]|nr:MAG: nucleotide exchange factor GrpE [Candidatus Thorarchaeota archaeon]